MCALNPDIDCKDESDTRDNPDDLRFHVEKVNKVGARKKRILTVLKKLRVIRSYDQQKMFKDTAFAKIQKLETAYDDRSKLTIYTKSGKITQYVFADAMAREKFLIHIRTLTWNDDKPDEKLEPITSPVTIFIGTWNVGSSKFPVEKLETFIPVKEYDILGTD
jgi:hypothetical protein